MYDSSNVSSISRRIILPILVASFTITIICSVIYYNKGQNNLLEVNEKVAKRIATELGKSVKLPITEDFTDQINSYSRFNNIELITLTSENHTILASTNNQWRGTSLNESGEKKLQFNVLKSSENWLSTSTYDEESKTQYFVKPINIFNKKDPKKILTGSIAIKNNISSDISRLQKNTIQFATIILCGMFVISMLYLLLIKRYVTSPITKITTILWKNTRDTKSEHIFLNQNDEIGYLAKSFNNIIDLFSRREETLQNKNKEYLSVLEDQSEILCRYLPDTTLTFVNKAYAHFFNKEPNELIGKQWINFFKAGERDTVTKHMLSFSANERSKSYEHNIKDANGKTHCYFWTDRAFFDEHGHIKYFQSTGTDISAVRNPNVQHDDQINLVTLNKLPVAFVNYNIDDKFSFNQVSENIQQILGLNKEDIIKNNLSLADFMPEAELAKLSEYVNNNQETNQVIHFKLRKANNELITVQQNSTKIVRDNKQQIEGILLEIAQEGSFENQQNIYSNDNLVTAQNNNNNVIENIGNAIKTPLENIIGMTNLMLNDGLSITQSQYAKTSLSSAKKLLEVVNNVAELNKISANNITTEKSEFNLHNLCLEVINEEQRHSHRNNVIQLNYDQNTEQEINSNKYAVKQILVNLINNANKYTSNGKILVKIEQVKEGDSLSSLKISVVDNGVGIEESRLKGLFQNQDSANENLNYHALGLAICRKLTKVLKGKIGVKSKSGSGSTFWFSFAYEPVKAFSSDSADITSRIKDIIEEVNFKDTKVLITETDPKAQYNLKTLLTNLGCNVTVAMSAKETIEKSKFGSYNLVLIDWNIHDIDPVEATGIIKAYCRVNNLKRPAFIALVNEDVYLEKANYLNSVMDGHLVKPVRQDELYETLSKWTRKTQNVESTIVPQKAKSIELPAIIAEDQFSQFKELLSNSYKNILNKYLVDVPRTLADMKQAAKNMDAPLLKQKAQNLKYPSNQIGAIGLSKIAEQIENMAKDSNFSNTSALLTNAETIYKSLKTTLEDRIANAS